MGRKRRDRSLICAACGETTTGDPCDHCGKTPILHGDYRLEKVLGTGAEGTTYRTRALEGGRVMAVKEMPLRHTERGLAAGMDDYITKPIDKTRLFAAFAQLNAGGVTAPPPPTQTEPPPTPVLNAEELWERLDNDVELFAQVRELFFSTSPGVLEKIRSAVDRADAEALVGPAHELKGMVGNLAGTAAAELARKLEFMGREADLSGAAEACDQLARELEHFGSALADLQPPD